MPYRRTGTATVIVNVGDINDNGPFLRDPVVYIEENMPIGSNTHPLQIRAMDADDNVVGHGPPFRMVPANGSEDSPNFKFTFHPGE